jgi:hypothetical protein
VNDGPDPVLGERRLKQLQRLAKAGKTQVRVFPTTRFMAVAAVLMLAFLLVGTFTFSLSSRRTYSGVSPAQVSSTTAGGLYRSEPASRPASRDSAVIRRRIDPAARDYGRDAQPEGHAMGGMGGYASAGGMSGRGAREGAGAAYGPDISANVDREVMNQQAVASEPPRLASSSSSRALTGALPRSLDLMLKPKEQEVAKETNGDTVVSDLRLNEDLGKKLTGAETDKVRVQARFFQDDRGNVAAEAPQKSVLCLCPRRPRPTPPSLLARNSVNALASMALGRIRSLCLCWATCQSRVNFSTGSRRSRRGRIL